VAVPLTGIVYLFQVMTDDFCVVLFQQSMQNEMCKHQSRVDSLMTTTLETAQQQIKTYVDEQRQVVMVLMQLRHSHLFNSIYFSSRLKAHDTNSYTVNTVKHIKKLQ